MKSSSRGAAQLYWQSKGIQPAHHRDRSVVFQPVHDGKFHDYQVEFTTGQPLVSLRFDPSQAAGEMEIESAILRDAQGATVAEWNFGK